MSGNTTGRQACAVAARHVASRSPVAVSLALIIALVSWSAARAADDPQPTVAPSPAAPADDGTEQQWAIHGQSTYTQQFQPAFRSPYQGAQSLSPSANGHETFDATLFAGFRPWQGAEVWVDPEIDQGFGLSNSFGVAGYLSGEAYKLGESAPYYRMSRAFFRQTIDLAGETQKVDADLNQLRGTQTADRLVLTVGKISVVDIFDTNKYAHDPRNDFLNWSVVDIGTFDYAADAWGATYGATAEWYQNWWTVRAGMFDLSEVPNSVHLNMPLLHQWQAVGELEERHQIGERAGKLKFLYWLSHGNLGTYADALALAATTGTTPSTAAVRSYRYKYGVALNLEQELTDDIGLFARAGWTQPGVEEDDFTDIDKSLQIGVVMTGARWGRPDDSVGVAAVANQISHSAKLYFAAGGLGGIIGDGTLPEAGPEQLIESYYSFAAFSFMKITGDYQFINNPAYNRQRGPVSVLALRFHVEY